MVSLVVVRDLPSDAKFPHIITTFKVLFKRLNIKKFWLKNLLNDGPYKQITIEVPCSADACKAVSYLNSEPIRYNRMEYNVRAHILEDSAPFIDENDYEDWETTREQRKSKRTRVRSRSPLYGNQPSSMSELDLEIELLRKKRQVIEEERRLLEEQRKLEMIKEYGPSASLEFENDRDFQSSRKRRKAEPMPQKPPKKLPKTRRNPNKPVLPVFFNPCRKLIAEMRDFIERDTTSEEVEILTKLIRAAIRKDLAIALEDKEYMKQEEIVKLYRERHPIDQDEAFVAKILANIRASYLNGLEVSVKVPENATDVAKVSENQVTVKEQIDTTDATTNNSVVTETINSQEPESDIEFIEDVTGDYSFGHGGEETLLEDEETKPAIGVELQKGF